MSPVHPISCIDPPHWLKYYSANFLLWTYTKGGPVQEFCCTALACRAGQYKSNVFWPDLKGRPIQEFCCTALIWRVGQYKSYVVLPWPEGRASTKVLLYCPELKDGPVQESYIVLYWPVLQETTSWIKVNIYFRSVLDYSIRIDKLPEDKQNYVALTGNFSVAGFQLTLKRKVISWKEHGVERA